MKRNAKYVALDVHQATTVASVREDSGRVIARTVLPTEAPALLEFFGGMRGAIHVAFEEGTQEQWLHECSRRGSSGSSSAIGGASRAKGTKAISSMPISSPRDCAAADCARCITGTVSAGG